MTPYELNLPLPGEIVTAHEESANGRKKEKKKKDAPKGKSSEFGRAVETLFRSAYHTHTALTAMADGKASILITINGLLLTIVLAAAGSWIARDVVLLLPVVILLLTCLGSLVAAALSARPRIMSARVTLESLRRDNANLLFFGNYTQLGEQQFREALAEMFRDPDRLYDVMARDLYGMGRVLSNKFRLLKRAYDIFVGGLILAVVSFIGAYLTVVF